MTNKLNGVNVDQLISTINLIKNKPDIANFTFRATNKWISGGHSKTTINGFFGAGSEQKRERAHVLDGDEPAVLLGEDHGANAVEAVLHALASCLAVGFVYNGAAQGIKVESLEFDLEGELDLHGFLGLSENTRPGYQNIKVNYRVKADAPREKLVKLCEYVQKTSPVLDIIKNPVSVSINLQ